MFNVIHRAEVSTTMDAAREPDVHLGVFDSLMAESQTAGRGQYRRNWGSPAGNLYASLRLPMEPPFVGTEAAVACGAYPSVQACADALVRAKSTTEPDPAIVEKYNARYALWHTLYPALKASYAAMEALQ